uniref:Lectin, mannose binding 1 like n=1 Tax=Saimiri boliviensis boliviensis TaxID=39432 RepID=A0A2K6SN75_SAIBB
MPAASGPGPLSRLLLLLLTPHSPEAGRPPLRRFEYKLSFKGPRLALPGAGIPFWSHHGDAILGLEEVRLAPSLRNRSGAVWSRASVPFSAWEVEVQMRVTGLGRQGAQGMAVWYTRSRGHVGSVLGALASWNGIGIFFDSSAEDTQAASHLPAEQPGHPDGAGQVLGSCHRDFRNRPHPFRARITYWGQRLRVFLNSGLTPRDPYEVCVDVGPLRLVPGGFFGVSAATSTLVPPQPFLEMEQLRLARQLEGLRARLGLGTREDVTPKSDSEAQEDGERLFDLEETLDRHRQTLQALQGLSERLAQAERQWKQRGPPGQARPDGGWALDSSCQIPSTPGRRGAVSWALDKKLDSAKLSALLHGQRTLLQALQGMRDAAVRMATEARVSYLPVGTEHHFLELDHILGLLQKELRGPAKAAAKAPRLPSQPPRASSCLQPGIFLFFLLIQTVGFCSYVHFRQKLDNSLQKCLSTGSLLPCPEPHTPRALGIVRRQPLPASMPA